MKKIILANGLTILFSDRNVRTKYNPADFMLSLTFCGGHITEPKLGLASLYEKIVTNTDPSLSSFCGGDITSFYAVGQSSNLEVRLRSLYLSCVVPRLFDDHIKNAASEIILHTQELALMPERQTKLAYKHTAFGQDNVVWDMDKYIQAIKSLTAQDVRSYITEHLVAKNMVLCFTGPQTLFDQALKLMRKHLGEIHSGSKKVPRKLLYTGGYQIIPNAGETNIAMFGWRLSHSVNFAELNILMSMLSSRLERKFSEAGIVANPIVKIAGYFGFRTLRISINCINTARFHEAMDIVCSNVRRLTNEFASDRRMEMSRNRAMTERLALPNDRLPRSIEAAWMLMRKGKEYNNNDCIDAMWQITCSDIRDTARLIFAERLTCVICTDIECPSYQDFTLKMK